MNSVRSRAFLENAEGPSFPSQLNEDTARMEYTSYFFFFFFLIFVLLCFTNKRFFSMESEETNISIQFSPHSLKQPSLINLENNRVLQLHCCRFSFHFMTLFCFSCCLCDAGWQNYLKYFEIDWKMSSLVCLEVSYLYGIAEAGDC